MLLKDNNHFYIQCKQHVHGDNMDTKTVRIKIDVYERVRKFGTAGDSISDAIENAATIAEKTLTTTDR